MIKVPIQRTLFIIAFLTGLLVPNAVFSQNEKDKLQEKKNKIEEEINYTNQLLDKTKSTKAANLYQLNLINKKIGKRQELIHTISSQVDGLEGHIGNINQNITQLQEDLKKMQAEYARLVTATYKNRDATSRLMFILSSKNFNQAYKRILYLKHYTAFRKAQAEKIRATQGTLNQQVTKLEKSKSSKEMLLAQKEKEKKQLTTEKKEKDKKVRILSSQEKSLVKKLRENQAALNKLQSAIRSLIAEEIRKANEAKARKAAEEKKKEAGETKIAENKTGTEKPGSKDLAVTTGKEAKPAVTTNASESMTSRNNMSANKEDIRLTDNFAANKGRLPWPVDRGIITESFGEHAHPDFKYIKTKNNGIDITCSPGSHARAIFDGEVSSVLFIAGINYVVMIRHGDYLSVYSNLQSVNVKKGEHVKTKQSIGTLVTDSDDGKTRIHFEVWHGTILVNPENWIAN